MSTITALRLSEGSISPSNVPAILRYGPVAPNTGKSIIVAEPAVIRVSRASPNAGISNSAMSTQRIAVRFII